jgi:hypothetical protein
MFDPRAEFPILRIRCSSITPRSRPFPHAAPMPCAQWSHQAQTEIGDIWPQWAGQSARDPPRRRPPARLLVRRDRLLPQYHAWPALRRQQPGLAAGRQRHHRRARVPANVYPWKNLARAASPAGSSPSARGAFTSMISFRPWTGAPASSASPLFATPTDTACLPSPSPKSAVSAGILFCLDAIQALGAMPVDVEPARL